mgnify:CR=1 FL=1
MNATAPTLAIDPVCTDLAVVSAEAAARMVAAAVAQAVEQFGGIDMCVNNASAINLGSIEEVPLKRFDLMNQINARGTFMVSKYAIPYLEKAANPHILMNSPPLDMQEKWFAGSTGYSIAKFGMSLVVLGLAGEARAKGIAGFAATTPALSFAVRAIAASTRESCRPSATRSAP